MVMIIEDELEIRESLKMALEMEGHQVVTATNGKEAIDMLGSVQPSVILLDLMMPVMDGREFLKHLRSDSDHPSALVPIVLISAAGDAARIASEKGVNQFLRKPVDLDHLYRVVSLYSTPKP